MPGLWSWIDSQQSVDKNARVPKSATTSITNRGASVSDLGRNLVNQFLSRHGGVKIARVFRHTRAEDVVIEGDFSLAKEWNFKLQARCGPRGC